MTLEEKIAHIQSVSMEEARAEGNEIISAYKTALEKVFEDHKKEAVRQSQTRVRAESTNARQQKNQAMAKAQLDLKRQQGKVQQELKEKLFAEVAELVRDFMKTPVLTVSAEDFMGGVRAVLRGRNILIDHSFKSSLENEYDQFIFSGGDDIG